MPVKTRCTPTPAGFTLIEVMIALVVTATGLLGVAKIQAAAIANTKISGNRALIALQTGSLVSVMHANPAFWASATVPDPWSVKAGVAPSDPVLAADVSATANCTVTCTPPQLAALDVQEWAASMAAQFPTYEAKINCTKYVIIQPVSCTVFVSWDEKAIAINQATVDLQKQRTRETFSVHLQP